MNRECLLDEIIFDNVPDSIKKQYYEWENLTKSLANKATEKKIPISITFELTPLCNLKCKMCYVRLEKTEMDEIGTILRVEDWIKIAEEAHSKGSLFLLITGGEPFLHPDFIEIYTKLSEMGFMIELYTNGSILNDEILSILKSHPPAHMSITIYGASEETYQKVCGNGKVYSKIVDNLKKIKYALNDIIPITIRTTCIKDNIDDVDNIRKLALELGLKYEIGFGILRPVRGAKRPDFDNVKISYKEMIEIMRENLKNVKNEKMYKLLSETVKDHEEMFNGKKVKDIPQKKNIMCKAAVSSCAISWDGKMLPCLIFSEPYTKPLDVGFITAWDNLVKMREEIIIPDRCNKCNYKYYCGSCPAYIQAESGTYKDDFPFSCEKNNYNKESIL